MTGNLRGARSKGIHAGLVGKGGGRMGGACKWRCHPECANRRTAPEAPNSGRPRLPRVTSRDCLARSEDTTRIYSRHLRLASHHSDGVSTAVCHAIAFSPSS